MKIALLAPPYLPVPPVGYGGLERIVYYLAEGLVKRGHEVTLFASGDSHTSARLVSTFTTAIGNSGDLKYKPLLPLIQCIDCYSRAGEFNIIHSHAVYLAAFFASLTKTPTVHTVHNTLYENEITQEKRMVFARFSDQNFVGISESQRQAMPQLNWVATVYNGVDIDEFNFSDKKGDYLLFMGRVTKKKGLLESIEVARKTGLKLKIAAAIDPEEQEYYEREIRPLIDGRQIEFMGETDGVSKVDLFANALCTLCPISWHEPFGLVMVESMACGTPVVAFDMGSASELVKDGVTGYVVGTVDEMIEAVSKIDKINREECRQRVEKYFAIEKMVDSYEAVYKNILSTDKK